MLRFLMLLGLVCLCACTKPQPNEQSTVSRKPAQLELTWEQAYDLSDPVRNKTTISPEIEATLLKIGPFHSNSTITIRSEASAINFHVVFLNEIKSDQAEEVLPIIKQALEPAKYSATFHGAEITAKYKITEQASARP